MVGDRLLYAPAAPGTAHFNLALLDRKIDTIRVAIIMTSRLLARRCHYFYSA
jgi:hypothetical protein